MCLGNGQSDLSITSSHAVAAGSALNQFGISNIGQLRVLLTNIRGLRQVAAELSKLAHEFKPHVIGIVETHLQQDPLRGLLPVGYKSVNRMDRTKHGGGLLWLSMRHLLVDKVNTDDYNIVSVAEQLAIEVQGETLDLCYTPKASLAPQLLTQCKNFKLDHPYRSINFLGDFNVHNPEWIHSTGDSDAGGIQAREMC